MKKILILMFVIALTAGCTSSKNYPMVGKTQLKNNKHAKVGQTDCGVTQIIRSTKELKVDGFKK